MSTLAAEISETDDLLLDRNFYNVLESHLSFLKENKNTRVVTVPDLTASIYAGDFYGLLNHLSVDKKFHYITMRCNGLYASGDYDGVEVAITIPPASLINSIFIMQNSKETT